MVGIFYTSDAYKLNKAAGYNPKGLRVQVFFLLSVFIHFSLLVANLDIAAPSWIPLDRRVCITPSNCGFFPVHEGCL